MQTQPVIHSYTSSTIMAHSPPQTQELNRPLPRPIEGSAPARPYRRVTVALILAVAALILALWVWGTPPGIYGKAEAIGYAICHRIADRSFLVDGRPLPLCVRCMGIYLGVLTGLGLLVAGRRSHASLLPPKSVLAMMAAFVLLLAADGLNSYLHLFPGYEGPYEPRNWLRLVSGSLTGLAMINLILPVFNAVVWARPQPERALRSWQEMGGLILVVLLLDALVMTQNPTVLLVLGLLTATGPVIVLTMVWTILFLSFTRRENCARSWRDLVIPLIAGVAITFLMIGGIDAVRFLLTGTWDGFDFSSITPAL